MRRFERRHLALLLLLIISGNYQTHASVQSWMYLGLSKLSSLAATPSRDDYEQPRAQALHAPIEQEQQATSPFQQLMSPPPTSTSRPASSTSRPALSPAEHRHLCRSIGLAPTQLRVCDEDAQTPWRISEAAEAAIGECQHQFKFERWNCSTSNDKRVFGKTLRGASKEAAFISALSSAAIVQAVVRACASGNRTDCGCLQHGHERLYANARVVQSDRQPNTGSWSWDGCSDDIEAGERFARKFVDAPELARQSKGNLGDLVRSRVTLHNNNAGRAAIRKLMRRQCRCHGLSGSCETMSCWMTLPSFREVSTTLKRKYDRAVRVSKRFRKRLRRRSRRERKRPIGYDELVYLRRSPDYCRPDRKRGIFGTTGRTCNRNSSGPDGCDLLCCGRGYNTQIERVTEHCRCKFEWCCKVKCDTCTTVREVYTCK